VFIIKTRPSIHTYTQHNISYSIGRRLAALDAYICTRSSATRDAVRSVSIFRSANYENGSCPTVDGSQFRMPESTWLHVGLSPP